MRVRKLIMLFGVILLSLGIAGNVAAENKSGSFTLSPFAGGYVFEGDQSIDDEVTYGIGLGYNLNEKWGLETVFNQVDTEYEGSGSDVDVSLYRLDALYHFLPSGKLVPYLAAGIGGIYMDPDAGENDTDFLANYGGGVKLFLVDAVALRADVRHIITFGPTVNNVLYSLGLTFAFGGEPAYEDSDGDGVSDYLDKCPGTPKGISVDASGCPLDSDGDGVPDYLDKCPDTPQGATVDASGCPLDSDGDGVPDYLDKCPDTPQGASVDASGCPLDSDGDGVPDYLDKCPDTPEGATVDTRGCWVIKGVLFDSEKWFIKPGAHKALDAIVEVLEKTPELQLEVQGHTDSRGSKSLNKLLSEKRAKAVMKFLVEKGIAKDRLTAKGLWFTKPAASNDTSAGRAMNRRVDLMQVVRVR